MRSNRYEYSDQVKAIFKEIEEMKKVERSALWCLNPKNNPSKDHYPELEKMYRASICILLYEISGLIDCFIADGFPVFADPTIGMEKNETRSKKS